MGQGGNHTGLPGEMEVIRTGPENNYYASGTRGRTDWISYTADMPNMPEKSGWKLHISAATVTAQEHLAALAMEFGIPEFKFARRAWLDNFPEEYQFENGKTAVFYHADVGTKGSINWDEFITRADEIVKEHGGPGRAVAYEKQIPGSSSVFYRHDRRSDGSYVDPRELSGLAAHGIPPHNPSNLPDPFGHINLTTQQTRGVAQNASLPSDHASIHWRALPSAAETVIDRSNSGGNPSDTTRLDLPTLPPQASPQNSLPSSPPSSGQGSMATIIDGLRSWGERNNLPSSSSPQEFPPAGRSGPSSRGR